MTRRPARIGWVVDCQVDFLDPSGRLYVKDLEDDADIGSAQIVPTLVRSVAWMHTHCDVVVFTGDWHALEDEEIDPICPDPAAGTYPPHCMGRSDDATERAGAAIIDEIRPERPLVLAYDADDPTARTVAEDAVRGRRVVFVQKNRFDVFVGNRATEAFLSGLEEATGRPLSFVVVGVARDVCVTQAIDGMQARGFSVTALRDATWGLGLEDEAETLERWAESGTVTTLDALEAP